MKMKPMIVWTVSIIDYDKDGYDIWTSSFPSEAAAMKFKEQAEAKFKKYGAWRTVVISIDRGALGSSEYLDWIDEVYGDLEE